VPNGALDVPAVLDVEASGFGRGSYPIEVGYVLEDGQSSCMLIRPEPEWTHWDPAAAGLHGITRAELLEQGLPAVEAAEELNYRLCGRTLYTDGWVHDYSWLALLYDAACRVPIFRLESLRALLTEDEIEDWLAAKVRVAAALGQPRHRACADARLLQATFMRLRAAAGGPPRTTATCRCRARSP
jgi:DNA polymerase III epsilon subunit-like protein